MPWIIRKSPFSRDEDVTQRMVSMLSEEARGCGISLTQTEKEELSTEGISHDQELRGKATKLIQRILERERASAERDPKGFSACLEWIEPKYPLIAAIAEGVITSGGYGNLPPAHGRAWIKDRALLIGCAFGLIVMMFITMIALSLVFGWE